MRLPSTLSATPLGPFVPIVERGFRLWSVLLAASLAYLAASLWLHPARWWIAPAILAALWLALVLQTALSIGLAMKRLATVAKVAEARRSTFGPAPEAPLSAPVAISESSALWPYLEPGALGELSELVDLEADTAPPHEFPDLEAVEIPLPPPSTHAGRLIDAAREANELAAERMSAGLPPLPGGEPAWETERTRAVRWMREESPNLIPPDEWQGRVLSFDDLHPTETEAPTP